MDHSPEQMIWSVLVTDLPLSVNITEMYKNVWLATVVCNPPASVIRASRRVILSLHDMCPRRHPGTHHGEDSENPIVGVGLALCWSWVFLWIGTDWFRAFAISRVGNKRGLYYCSVELRRLQRQQYHHTYYAQPVNRENTIPERNADVLAQNIWLVAKDHACCVRPWVGRPLVGTKCGFCFLLLCAPHHLKLSTYRN